MAQSVIAAVMTKFDGLTASGFPSSSRPHIYLDSAPQVDGSGNQVRPPYVVLRDGGMEPTYAGFERNTLEVSNFTLEIYYPNSMADVDTAVAAVKLNGGTRDQASGFDYGTLSALTSPRQTHQILRTRETRRLSGYGQDGKPVFVCSLEYRVTVQESAT